MKRVMTAAALVLMVQGEGRGQDPVKIKELAELFPARTRAYLEISQIAEVVKEIRPLLKGSCLDDLPGSLEKLRGKKGDDDFFYSTLVETAGMALSPDGLTELSRLRAGAVGVTDLPKDRGQDPDYLAVLLTGDSHLPALWMRLKITMEGVKTVAEVEGVRIYRRHERIYPDEKFGDGPGDGPPKGPAKPGEKFRVVGPAMALAPGAILIGSRTDGVKDAIRRLKGKDAGSTLAGVAEFRNTASLRKQPGLFAYADGESLVRLSSFFNRRPVDSKKDFWEEQPLELDGPKEPKEKDALPAPVRSLLASAKSFGTVAASLTLKDGALELRGLATFHEKHAAAWPDFFTARTVNTDLLHYVPKEARAAFAFALPDGGKFWDKLGKMAPAFETHLSLTLGSGALEKITQVVAVDLAAGASKDWPGPVFIVEVKDADGIRELTKAFPRNIKVNPEAKRAVAVIGPNAALLQRMVEQGAAKKGLLSLPKVAQAIKGHEQAQALVLWSPGQALVDEFQAQAENLRNFKPREFDKDKPGEADREKAALKKLAKELDRLAADLTKTLDPVPPCVLSIAKKDNHLVLSGRQTNLRPAIARLLDILVERDLLSNNLRFGVGGLLRIDVREAMRGQQEKTQW